MKPHKHAELIKAWADGAEIQFRVKNSHEGGWYEWEEFDEDCNWLLTDTHEYRIKPEPKPNVECLEYVEFVFEKEDWIVQNLTGKRNLKLTFDGETGELKSAEVLK